MLFEFDPRKSETNKAKHGIDFVEAQTLWRSKVVLLGAKDASEKRYMAIGRMGRQHLVGDYHLSRRDDSDYKCEEIHSTRDRDL